ncbi:MAG: hypothetical protein FWC19_09375 [Treponema sp.]|nr:hypothetical protein [Treponema sp.]MCL2272994.1 hypothetical protein [Treponema sp.]
MKKLMAVLVVFICTGAALSAQISAGIGFYYDHSFNNGAMLSYTTGSQDLYTRHISNLSGGAYLFLDASYIEFDVGFAFGFLSENGYWRTRVGNFYSNHNPNNQNLGNVFQLNFSLLGKYPIDIGNITLFPLLGINYNLFLVSFDNSGVQIEGDAASARNYSQFGFQAGVGADFNISDKVYFRAEGLFQLRLVLESSKIFQYIKFNMREPERSVPTPGMGPIIKAAFGYRFN